jgi:hypothetical protein
LILHRAHDIFVVSAPTLSCSSVIGVSRLFDELDDRYEFLQVPFERSECQNSESIAFRTIVNEDVFCAVDSFEERVHTFFDGTVFSGRT